MFETFSRNQFPSESSGRTQDLFEEPRDDFRLWLARRFAWPIQPIPFQGLVAAPRQLTVLEKIVLEVYLTMVDQPPDSVEVARELAIEDSHFIEETLWDLAELGAMELDCTARPRVTDLGSECYRCGHLPTEPRKQMFSLLFDPIAGDFPDGSIDTNPEGIGKPDTPLGVIHPTFVPADPERIDLDTIRSVAVRQMPQVFGSEAVIFDARSVGSATQQTTRPNGSAPGNDIRWCEVVLLVFLNSVGQLRLRVNPLGLRTWQRWFQQAIEQRLTEAVLDWKHLLGTLLVKENQAAALKTVVSVATPAGNAALDWVAVMEVQNQILTAVNQAQRQILLQSRYLDNQANCGPLAEVILKAARRGVQCYLLWESDATVNTQLVGLNIPTHDNIKHRCLALLDQEIMLVDERCILGSSACRTQSPTDQALPVLLTGLSRDRRLCREAAVGFWQAWQRADSAGMGGPHSLNQATITTPVSA